MYCILFSLTKPRQCFFPDVPHASRRIWRSPRATRFAQQEAHAVVTRGCPFAWSQPFDRLGDDQDHADLGTMQFDHGSSSVGRTDGLGGNVGTHISDAETFTDLLGNTVLCVHSCWSSLNVTVMMDREALYDISRRKLDVERSTYNN